MKLYLAGAITGLTYDGANSWREKITPELEEAGIEVLSPLRAKEFLRNYGVLERNYHNASPLSTSKGIVTRDRNDVMNCDVVLMNLLDAEKISIGSMVEVGWADMMRKPIVVVRDPEGPYRHEFITEIAGYIVDTLDEALDIIYAIDGATPPVKES